MIKIEPGKSPFRKIDHVGMIVRDMDRAIEYYRSLGIGPFKQHTTDTRTNKTIQAEPAEFKIKIAMVDISPIKLELIQPVEGRIPQQEFLESRGEGLHHIGFLTDDLDKQVAELAGKGLKVILRVKRTTGGGVAYFDTRNPGGVIFELVQPPPK